MRVAIRWMIRADMPQVMAIENECFQFAWSEDDFIRCLRERSTIGMVIEYDEQVVGYMIYDLHKNKLEIMNFAVHPARQRRGFGAAMVKKLDGKLSANRRTKIICNIRETNIDAQLFFSACGFKAVSILRDHYHDTPEDAYKFEYRYAGEVAEVEQLTRSNER